ncbi:site-specific integrase [Streptomyces sp. cg28]|uniref:site-specific integrase n=1 Tax=Streptomyces sp. cg28 TaxID=3403457 RepID=UPI003B21EB70
MSGRALVLSGRPLRPGARLEDTSRFVDDIWVLDPAWLRADRKSMTLNFTGLPDPLATAVKHLSHALLTEDLPPGEQPLSISSIHTYFSCLRGFLLWVHARGRTLAQIGGDDLDAYHHHLLAQRLCSTSVRRYRRAVRMLWAYRTRLPDHLAADPARRPLWQAWARAHSSRVAENLTQRIPEPVLGPLLTWALRWVDDFADDVLRARDERDRINTLPPAGTAVLGELARLLNEYRSRKQPLPYSPPHSSGNKTGRSPFPSTVYLGRLLGCPVKELNSVRAQQMIAEAAREVGVDSDCHLAHQPQGMLDGQTWTAAISYYEVGRLEKLLHVSCWIVIAYLSGMRDSEIKHLQRGCLSVQRTPDGTVYRHRLHSLAFKGESPHGTPAAWIVTAPVARAVAVLEQLQPDTETYLFTFLPSSRHHRQSPTPGAVFDSNTTNTQITDLIRWINTYCAQRTRPDRIPAEHGRTPRLTTRQFRRTLAWFIARRPGGTIAGALQYRHQRIQMFEGYADPRELHQTGEKSQVACSRREPGGLRRYYDLTS